MTKVPLRLIRCASLYEQSPAFNQSDELEPQRQHRRPVSYETKVAERDILFRRWLCLWRSIILSSVDGKTYKPYCRYLRTLDFRNLAALFEDNKFLPDLRASFFRDDLERFFHTKGDVSIRQAKGRKLQLVSIDVFPTLDAIGEAVSLRHNP